MPIYLSKPIYLSIDAWSSSYCYYYYYGAWSYYYCYYY